MAEPAAGEKLKVFISYSRRDSADFADEMVAGLEYGGFAPFLDRHDIAAGEDWEARLSGLIEQSDTVVFVVSPEAVKSERCVWEVERTLALSKRLLPVIHKPVAEADIPEPLRRLQFVRFDSGRGFARPLAELAEALRIDLDWIREHTRLGELAGRWTARGRPESLLLRGDDLDAAKAWAAKRKAGAPEITEVQRAFLLASDEGESARLGKERAQLEEMRLAQAATARHQRRAGRLLWGVTVLVLGMIGYVTWQAYDVSRREVAVFSSLAAQAMNDQQFDRALRYALQTYPARGRLPWLTPFSTELEGKLAGGAQSTRLHRLLSGHSRRITVVAYSPDATRILTASDDGTARVWDAETGAEIAAYKPEAGRIASAVFAPDGKRVALAPEDATARIWDFASGRELILKGHDQSVAVVAFDREGRRVATASFDNTARIWDAENGSELAVLKGHTQVVYGVAFSDSGQRVVTSSWDATARVWDANDGKEIAVLKGHVDWVVSPAFDHAGKRVLTAGIDGTSRIWDAERGEQLIVLKGHESPVWSARFDPEDKRVVTGSADGTARIWDADSGREIFVLKARLGAGIRSAAFNPEGSQVVTASYDNAVRVWDAANGALIVEFKGHAGEVRVAEFSPNGERVVSGSDDNTVRIWNVTDPATPVVLRGHAESVYRAAFSPDGRRAVTASFDKTARIWDVGTGSEIAKLEHTAAVLSARFDPLGKRVVTACGDGTIHIWDTETGKEILLLKGHTDRVETAAFDHAGHRVVSGGFDQTARIWNAGSGELIHTVNHPSWVRNAEFAPDDRRVVTAVDRRQLAFIWDSTTYKLIVPLEGHTGQVSDAQFDREGKRVATASWDGTARIWDAESGKELALMTAHNGASLHSSRFDPEGDRIVTAGSDGAARIWDVPSGKEITGLRGHSGTIFSAALSADGRRVVTASGDKTARIWDVTWATRVRGDELRDRVCAEKLVGAAQEFTEAELEDAILRGIDKDDPVARNPCLRRGPLSFEYWTRLPARLSRFARSLF